MSQARGTQTIFALFEEAVYKTEPGTPDGKKLHIRSFGVVPSQNKFNSEILSSDRARSQPGKGNKDVAGAIVTELSGEDLSTMIKHALGTVVTTGTAPYTHTITIGALPVGLTLEKDNGSNISGTGRYERFNGCRVADATFDFPEEGHCMGTFNIKGAKHALQSAALDATLTDAGHTSFTSFDASIEEGGASIATVKSAQIKIDNDLDDSAFVIGGDGEREDLAEGFTTVTGSITSLFDSVDLYTKAINNTTSNLKITLSRGDGLGSAGNESMEFFVQNLEYEVQGVPVDGPRGLLVKLNFTAFKVSTDLGLQVTVKNALSAV